MTSLGEPPSVTITRLICTLVLSLVVMGACVVLLLTHPEYAAGATLAAGMVLGSWFGVIHQPSRRT